MDTIRIWIARAALRVAAALALPGSEADRALRTTVTALGSGGAGPWRPR